MIRIGCDLALCNSAICVNNNNKLEFLLITTSKLKKHNIVEYSNVKINIVNSKKLSIKERIDLIINFINKASPDKICLEGHSFGGKNSRKNDAIEMIGAVRYFCLEDYKLKILAPTSLKKQFSGSGKSKKDEMYDSVTHSDLKMCLTQLCDFFKLKKDSPGISDIVDAFALSIC